MEIMDGAESIKKIESYLKQFELVLVFLSGQEIGKNWIEQFMKSMALKNAAKKTLILSDLGVCGVEGKNYEYRRMDRNMRGIVERLYTMYDFSDRFILLSDYSQYGSLLNYVKTGMITLEEAFQTFFE